MLRECWGETAAGEGPSGTSPAARCGLIFDNLVLGKSCIRTAMSVEQSSDKAVFVLSVRALEKRKGSLQTHDFVVVGPCSWKNEFLAFRNWAGFSQRGRRGQEQ